LSGTGLLPVASVAPASLAFSAPFMVASAPQILTVSNTGTAPLSITNVTRSGLNATSFTHVNNCPATLAVGAQCTVSVTFMPRTTTPVATVNINVLVAAPATNVVVPVTGTLLVPTFTISPGTVSFGTQSVAGGQKLQTVTITNTSTAPLRITGISRLGGDATQFPAPTHNCPISTTSLAGGASCTVTARFDPTTAGLKTTSLQVTVAAPATTQQVTMTGTGTLP
jgi:hypothetical protein